MIIAWEHIILILGLFQPAINAGVVYTMDRVRFGTIFMLSRLKNALIGSPLPTQQLGEKRLNKIRALAAFSPDALSSIAYANQEIYLGLVVAGSAGLGLAWPIGLGHHCAAGHRRHVVLPDHPGLSIGGRFLHRRP